MTTIGFCQLSGTYKSVQEVVRLPLVYKRRRDLDVFADVDEGIVWFRQVLGHCGGPRDADRSKCGAS